jgi:hypothetical protein
MENYFAAQREVYFKLFKALKIEYNSEMKSLSNRTYSEMLKF